LPSVNDAEEINEIEFPETKAGVSSIVNRTNTRTKSSATLFGATEQTPKSKNKELFEIEMFRFEHKMEEVELVTVDETNVTEGFIHDKLSFS